MPWIAYTMDSGDVVFEQKSKKEILTSIKDAYGCPYISGSSLKGALRTILLGAKILRDREAFRKDREAVLTADLRGSSKQILSREVKQLEQHMFNRLNRNKERKSDAVNDIMCGLRIGDSEPLSVDDLTLCQKIDVTVDGGERALPILRECIKPETEVRFPVTIDPEKFEYPPKQILKAATEFAQNYDECFLNRFPVRNIRGGGNLYLGGGCGYVSKTASYPLLGKSGVKRVSVIINSTIAPKARAQHKHYRDAGLGVSPHMLKCTRYGGRLYKMGACTLSIQ